MENIKTHGNNLMSAVSKFAAAVWARHLIRQERRVSYWQLQNMTDIDLKDIGISRCDIRREVFGRHD